VSILAEVSEDDSAWPTQAKGPDALVHVFHQESGWLFAASFFQFQRFCLLLQFAHQLLQVLALA
jgi:hypothetical protein